MGGGHVPIPPPEFDPRDVEALRRLAEQNHQNALGQSRGLGWVVFGMARVVSWPVRSVVRRIKGKADRESGA